MHAADSTGVHTLEVKSYDGSRVGGIYKEAFAGSKSRECNHMEVIFFQ